MEKRFGISPHLSARSARTSSTLTRPRPARSAALAARLAGPARPPVVAHTFHGHTLRATSARPSRTPTGIVERALARETDALIAVSPEVRDDLVAIGVGRPSQFAVIRLGIELSERMAGSERGDELRASLGIAPDRFTIGWVGRMTAVKRAHDVLRTLKLLHERGVDAALVMVGDGPDRPELEALARELGIEQATHFVGFQDDVGPWFHAFDALLLPSRNEGTPVSAIETLAAGRPVVAIPRRRRPGRRRRRQRRLPLSRRRRRRGRRSARSARRRPRAPRAGWARRGRERALARYRVPRLVDDVDRLYRALLAAKGSPVAAGGGAPTVNQ